MSMNSPVSLRPLLQNLWVFAVYGFLLAIAIAVASTVNASLAVLSKIMMEPFSVYSFMLLSLCGLLALSITNVTVAKTGPEMRSSWWVRHIFVPITDAGLSAGAIILGTSLGLALGMFLYASISPDALKLAKLLGGLSILLFLLVAPLAWFERSLFDVTPREQNITACSGTVYCVLTFVLWWLATPNRFILHVGALVTSAAVSAAVYVVLRRRRLAIRSGERPTGTA